VVAVQLPGTTAYTTGLLYTEDATDTFLQTVSVGMTTKVQMKSMTVEPRQLLLSMGELASNSGGTKDSNNGEVNDAATMSESSQTVLTKTGIEEVASTAESSQTPLTETATKEVAATAESSQNLSGEAVSKEVTSIAESSQNPSAEAAVKEATFMSEPSQNPSTDAAIHDAVAAIEEAIPTSDSQHKPSTEATPGEVAEAESPAKKNSNPFEELLKGLFR